MWYNKGILQLESVQQVLDWVNNKRRTVVEGQPFVMQDILVYPSGCHGYFSIIIS